MSAGLLAKTLTAQVSDANSRGGLTRGYADIRRFLAAAELIEADLWLQYNELGREPTDEMVIRQPGTHGAAPETAKDR